MSEQYEDWFRAEVEAGIQEADSPGAKFVPHADVVAEGKRRRTAWLGVKA